MIETVQGTADGFPAHTLPFRITEAESPGLKTAGRRLCRRPEQDAYNGGILSAGDLFHVVGLDDVAQLDVVELIDGQAALIALFDLLDGVLEPLEGAQSALVGPACPS